MAYIPRPTHYIDQHTSPEPDSAKDIMHQTPEIIMPWLNLHLWMTEVFRFSNDVTKWIGELRRNLKSFYKYCKICDSEQSLRIIDRIDCNNFALFMLFTNMV